MKESDKTRHYLNTFVRTSIFVLFSLVLSKAVTYVYKIIIARYFGASTYGNFSLAMIITGFFVAFGSLGFADGLVRYFSFYLGKNQPSRIRYFISIANGLMLISGIVGGALLYFLADPIAIGIFHEPQLALFLRAFSVVVPLALLSNIYIALLRSYERAKTASFLVGAFQNGIRAVIILLFILLGVGLSSLFYSYVISYLLLLLVAIYCCRELLKRIRKAPKLAINEKRKLRSDLFTYSWPLVFVSLLFSMFYWTDSLVLGYFTNANIVGFYNAAITLVGLFVIAPDLFSLLFLPIVSKELSRNNKTIIRDITKQLTKWIVTLNIPVLVFLFIFPEALLNLFFGAEFIVAAPTLRILAVGGIFSGFLNTFTNLLSAKKETKLILYNFIFFSFINLLLDLLFIRYAMAGVATATTLSWIGFCITLFFEIKKKYGFYPVKRSVLRTALVSVVPVGVTIFNSFYFGQTISNLFISAALFAILYGIVLAITKTLDENDLNVIKDIRSKLARTRGSSQPLVNVEP